MLEGVEDDAGHGKAKEDELQDVPERLEVLEALLSQHPDAADEEVDGEEGVGDFKQQNHQAPASNVGQQAEYL